MSNTSPTGSVEEHQHQFTIPVEWKVIGEIEDAAMLSVQYVYVPDRCIVTVLACVCGAESSRRTQRRSS